ncbi:hypothetical protein K0M31_011503 [Melipona bicolor]|uniref:Uncharacterized protein n=1 Tax=Melipona bicolor TaxID=60889 RepID=A0AA40G9S0_9HYME|nr:hypothetical protein K0M31_011503 [Melipona bicolor]
MEQTTKFSKSQNLPNPKIPSNHIKIGKPKSENRNRKKLTKQTVKVFPLNLVEILLSRAAWCPTENRVPLICRKDLKKIPSRNASRDRKRNLVVERKTQRASVCRQPSRSRSSSRRNPAEQSPECRVFGGRERALARIAWTACGNDECGRKRRSRGEEAAAVHGVTDLSPPITVQSVMFDAAVVFYAATSKRCVPSRRPTRHHPLH